MEFDPEEYERQFLGEENNPTPNKPVKEQIEEAKSDLDKAMAWLGDNLNKIPDWVVIIGILVFFLITIIISLVEEK